MTVHLKKTMGNTLLTMGLGALLTVASTPVAMAQCGYAVGLGCSTTDYSNFGFKSNNDATTIEYDNFTSAFHATVVRDADGQFYIWGEGVNYAAPGNNNPGNFGTKTEINATTFPGLTGIPLKATMGSGMPGSTSSFQQGTSTILLTTDGLFAWGKRGSYGILDDSGFGGNMNRTGFIKMEINGKADGLPANVTPMDVKMMFGTLNTLAIVTCDGAAWVLSQRDVSMRGSGSGATSSNIWYRVRTNSSTYLENVIALRGSYNTMIALTGNNEVYTWGVNTLLGTENSFNSTARNYATKMTLPESTPVKMIASSTFRNTGSTYYVLYTNGNLYGMGYNGYKQLGDFSTTSSPSSSSRRWVRPRYSNASNDYMDDIVWISSNEHDNWIAAVNVINDNARLWNWGINSGSMLGRTVSAQSNTSNTAFDPGQPLASVPLTANDNFSPTISDVLAVETGGHTTMIVNQCEENFGYMGHIIRGSASTGSTSTTWPRLDFETTDVNICGAEAVAAIQVIIPPVKGSGNTICAGQTVYLRPIPAGGTLSLASGPGVISNGNELNFTATTGTVTVSYVVDTDCGVQSVFRSFELSDCPLQFVRGTVWIDDNSNAVIDAFEHGTNAATHHNDGLWATLVDDSGKVVTAVPVSIDGRYSIPQHSSTDGTFSVVITKELVSGGIVPPAASTTLPGGWQYTGNNPSNNTPCLTPGCTTTPYTIDVTLSGGGSDNNDFGIKGVYTLSGNVFHDKDGLNGTTQIVDGYNINTVDSAYQRQGQPQLYVSMIDSDGSLIHYVPVRADGTYKIDIPLDEDVALRLTTTPGTPGTTAPPPVLPLGWTHVGEAFGNNNSQGNGMNDGTGTGSNAPPTRYNGDIDVTFTDNNEPVTHLDFGLQQPPVAQPKEYLVANADFGASTGFPGVAGYKAIPMNSASLVEINDNSNGSLSGKDSEDCPAGDCNGSGGIVTTFTIGAINGNTKLYYDFGTGPVEITDGTSIPDFDYTKMAIYGTMGSGGAGDKLGFTYTVTDVAGSTSPLALYSIETMEPLPLELLDFNGRAEAYTSILDWHTAKEEQVSHFNILRSTDGIRWEPIGTLDAQNKLSNAYNFVDENPVKGLNYYKLYMADLDASGSYSGVVTVNHDKVAKGVTIAPNPVKNDLNLSFRGFSDNEVIISVLDHKGRIVVPGRAYAIGAPVNIDVSHLSADVYIIEVEAGSQVYKQKFVKQ